MLGGSLVSEVIQLRLTCISQSTSDLTAPWQNFTGNETVQSIDTEWERVTIEEDASGQG